MKPLNQMPDNTRVWVYLSKNKLDQDEVNYVKVRLDEFMDTWESHGELVDGGYEIIDNQFVVIYASEEGGRLCGRAVSASVDLMKQMEQELETELMNRMNIAYKENEKAPLKVTDYNTIQQMLVNNELPETAIIYNNAVINKTEFDKNWQQPLNESWLKQVV